MALPLPPGMTPSEVAFLCEMELVTVVPRQRLEGIALLGGRTPPLQPPHRATLPLWLALLLKKQRRANIVPPPWLHPSSLRELINHETHREPAQFSPPPPPPARADARGVAHRLNPLSAYTAAGPRGDDGMILSPPFLPSCTADAPAGFLPYHWFELAETLLAHAADDMPAPAGEVRSLLRDLVEVRAAKMRAGSSGASLEGFFLGAGSGDGPGGIMSLRGVGAMELAESRGFVLGVVDGVRRIGASAEASRREEEMEGGGAYGREDESDEEMDIEPLR